MRRIAAPVGRTRRDLYHPVRKYMDTGSRCVPQEAQASDKLGFQPARRFTHRSTQYREGGEPMTVDNAIEKQNTGGIRDSAAGHEKRVPRFSSYRADSRDGQGMSGEMDARPKAIDLAGYGSRLAERPRSHGYDPKYYRHGLGGQAPGPHPPIPVAGRRLR
jgi:hypothetical protein